MSDPDSGHIGIGICASCGAEMPSGCPVGTVLSTRGAVNEWLDVALGGKEQIVLAAFSAAEYGDSWTIPLK